MQVRRAFAALWWIGSVLLSACGGGGDSSAPVGPPPSPPAAPTVTLNYGIKQLQFSWAAVSGATHYRLLERPDAAAAFAQVGTNLTVTSVNHDIALHKRVNAAYRIEACNSVGCTASSDLSLATNLLPAIGYFKASNTQAGDAFSGVALSADGNTLAVGATGEDSNATGVNGDQSSNSADHAGAVYVFARSGTSWAQEAYIKASNAGADDVFGTSVALSADGSTLAVGARDEDSNATGVSGDELDNSAVDSGAVYVFVRSAGAWSQQAYIKASNTGAGDSFGVAVALNATGDTLAVGAPYEASNAIGVNGSEANNLAPFAGAVYVFTRGGNTWSQQAYLKASNTNALDLFGGAVALSDDGSTLAVRASGEDSNATGINGVQSDNSAPSSGAVYVFTRAAGSWTQHAYIKGSNTEANDTFGSSVALSADGATLAVGAIGEASSATGANGNQTDNSASGAGAAYVFTRTASVWTQQAYIKASNAAGGGAAGGDAFGRSVALSADGSTLAIGASGEASNAAGVNGDQSNNSAPNAGAVYVFTRNAAVWTQQAYIKAPNPETSDQFGIELALSGDGGTLAIGAPVESSSVTGIGGSQSNNLAAVSGAVYLY